MASRILGMGDILSLVEEAHAKVDEQEARKLAKKFKKGKDFDLEDFKSQLQQMKKMGGLAGLHRQAADAVHADGAAVRRSCRRSSCGASRASSTR